MRVEWERSFLMPRWMSCWTAGSKYTFNYPWLIRDTVLFFFLFGTIFTAIRSRASRCWLVPMTLETRATFNRVCRAIRRGRFARWLNDLGTAHCSLRFLIINLNVLNSIFLRVFSRFHFGFSLVIIEILEAIQIRLEIGNIWIFLL